MTYAVILTASRGGAIALVVAVLVCLWQLGVKSRRLYLLLLVPASGIAIWLYSANTLQERFDQTEVDAITQSRTTEASSSAQQRKELLIQSLKVTAQYPLFGVGPGNFTVLSGVWRVTHNSYTQISSEGGIPAFVFYVLIFWRGVANLKEVGRYNRIGKEHWQILMALQASLAAFLVGSCFASDAYQLFPYCLVVYTSSLRLIVSKTRIGSRSLPRVNSVSPATEMGIWQ